MTEVWVEMAISRKRGLHEEDSLYDAPFLML